MFDSRLLLEPNSSYQLAEFGLELGLADSELNSNSKVEDYNVIENA